MMTRGARTPQSDVEDTTMTSNLGANRTRPRAAAWLRFSMIAVAIGVLGALFYLRGLVATEHQPSTRDTARAEIASPPRVEEADESVIESHEDGRIAAPAHAEEDPPHAEEDPPHVTNVVLVEPTPEPWQTRPGRTDLPPGYTPAWEVEHVAPDGNTPAPPPPSDPGPPSVAEAVDVIDTSDRE
jgi:hypothetical protein